jgi:uncharacterized protein
MKRMTTRTPLLALLLLVAACGVNASNGLELTGPTAVARTDASQALPAPTGYVTDLAALLDDTELHALERELCAYEERTGREFALLTVPTTAPESIEDYSLRVARGWRLGKPGRDDGLLLVIAANDRCARIEVGLGLSPDPIPDELAEQVLQRDLLPALAEGRWAEGCRATLRALMAAADRS